MVRTTAGWRGIITTTMANMMIESNFKEKVRTVLTMRGRPSLVVSFEVSIRRGHAPSRFELRWPVVHQEGPHCPVHRQALGRAVHRSRTHGNVVVDRRHEPVDRHGRTIHLVRPLT